MSVKSASELKALQSREKKLIAEHSVLLDEQKRTARAAQEAANQLASIREKIKAITQQSEDVIVTEHALLRYLERVKGIDMDAIRSELLAGKESAIRVVGSGKLKTGGIELVIKNRSVVSITVQGQ